MFKLMEIFSKNIVKEYSLSLKDLADLAHVSRATMYKYENGKS